MKSDRTKRDKHFNVKDSVKERRSCQHQITVVVNKTFVIHHTSYLNFSIHSHLLSHLHLILLFSLAQLNSTFFYSHKIFIIHEMEYDENDVTRVEVKRESKSVKNVVT